MSLLFPVALSKLEQPVNSFQAPSFLSLLYLKLCFSKMNEESYFVGSNFKWAVTKHCLKPARQNKIVRLKLFCSGK